MPKILSLKLKARKIITSGLEDPDEALLELLGKKSDMPTIKEYGNFYVKELRDLATKHEKKGMLVERNRKNGSALAYENAVNQFCYAFPKTTLDSLDYNTLMKFRTLQEAKGNSKSTIALYFRMLRALYNKGLKIYKITDNRPFNGVFDGLRVSATASKKKYLKRKGIRALEEMQHHSESTKKYTDLFLLQFYFGGCDLTDIYFMRKNQLVKGRVYFERGKTTSNTLIDLKIHPKAQEIINRWSDTKNDTYIFPWRKDQKGYQTFRNRYQKFLIKAQERAEIFVHPTGGNIGVKVARHTFGNLGKKLRIDNDILRELMGHEREDIDQYYKDKFSKKVRDKALFEIINYN
ncbi:tyrosine-type recombinase/integrase [Flavobacterium sp. NKUCC04_CG]|uniref:tyrosine-type recombinase/integrase n=1 Tax=Flavobacterium sp. NKUCC04_CG TaxID=2842121 RepID=UPI001C5B4FE6|nr:tyrosine-type recombinase/integrase [Flavobacterium sp. NKUCC04_CG]MBW3518318.1 site-specific integrase [Flavobacterium sp. NKUCC04_CG]